jgi:cell division protein FtsI/penicillin-binding protein 2
MGGRFITLIVLIFGAYAFILFHLYELQIAKGKYYSARAESQYAAFSSTEARRGTIYFTDKDGNKLPAALEKDFPVIYAVPKEIEDVQETSNELALLLGRPAAAFTAALSKKSSSYSVIDKNPGEDAAKRVIDAHVKGVYGETVPRRYYPFGALAAQVLGFVGPNADNAGESGKYGLEKYHENELSGAAAAEAGYALTASASGDDVALTLDPAIQTEAEHIMKNLVAAHRAKGASVIVADPKTGAILAMASTPAFDPNHYASSSIASFKNPIVEEIYEPGSVVKVLTMVAGIDTGKISPDTTYNDTGTLNVNGKTIHNWDLIGHGKVTMTEVIEGSINTGAAFAERKTGNEVFRSYLQKLGLAQKTGIDLPGELTGSMAPIMQNNAPEINFATASFGQGISATALQVLQAIESIANGGNLMRPYVNADTEPQVTHRVMSEDTAKKVTAMMVSAVDKAKIATIDGYSVAGKTGTAQVPDFVHGGYTENVVDTYTGFAPASNPRFIALIKLNEPYGAPHAAETVVPAFHELAEYLLSYFQVPPDRVAK